MDIEKFLHRDFGVHTWHNTTTLQELKELFLDEKRLDEKRRHYHYGDVCMKQMPQWRAEFEQLCRQYEEPLYARERKRLERCAKETHNFEWIFWQSKITDTLLWTGSAPDAPYRLLESLKAQLPPGKNANYFIKIPNFSVDINMDNLKLTISKHNGQTFFVVGQYQNIRLHFDNTTLLTQDLLRQIDTLLPMWESEYKDLMLTVQKQKKTEIIAQNTIRILVKQRMKEMGWEYRLSTERDNLLLMVKLQKKRILKVTLPADNMERVKRRLDELAEFVQHLNDMPMYFRIAYQSNGMRWEKEA